MEAGSDNLALLHCSCLHACLVAYSNILRSDLNTTCITITSRPWTNQREVWWAWEASVKSGD